MIKIAVIIGSTRPGRNGEAVARWVYEIAKKRSDAEFELVVSQSLKDFDLFRTTRSYRQGTVDKVEEPMGGDL